MKKHIILSTVLLLTSGVAFAATVGANSWAADTAEETCGPVLQLPEGTAVHRDATGQNLVLRTPPGWKLQVSGSTPHFVTVDPDTILVGPESLLTEVDCNCEGPGGCTEVYQPSKDQIYCDRFDGCSDCRMDINPE